MKKYAATMLPSILLCVLSNGTLAQSIKLERVEQGLKTLNYQEILMQDFVVTIIAAVLISFVFRIIRTRHGTNLHYDKRTGLIMFVVALGSSPFLFPYLSTFPGYGPYSAAVWIMCLGGFAFTLTATRLKIWSLVALAIAVIYPWLFGLAMGENVADVKSYFQSRGILAAWTACLWTIVFLDVKEAQRGLNDDPENETINLDNIGQENSAVVTSNANKLKLSGTSGLVTTVILVTMVIGGYYWYTSRPNTVAATKEQTTPQTAAVKKGFSILDPSTWSWPASSAAPTTPPISPPSTTTQTAGQTAQAPRDQPTPHPPPTTNIAAAKATNFPATGKSLISVPGAQNGYAISTSGGIPYLVAGGYANIDNEKLKHADVWNELKPEQQTPGNGMSVWVRTGKQCTIDQPSLSCN